MQQMGTGDRTVYSEKKGMYRKCNQHCNAARYSNRNENRVIVAGKFHERLELYHDLYQTTASTAVPSAFTHLSTYWQSRKLRHKATAMGVSSFK
jgi:hypothetical protein